MSPKPCRWGGGGDVRRQCLVTKDHKINPFILKTISRKIVEKYSRGAKPEISPHFELHGSMRRFCAHKVQTAVAFLILQIVSERTPASLVPGVHKLAARISGTAKPGTLTP